MSKANKHAVVFNRRNFMALGVAGASAAAGWQAVGPAADASADFLSRNYFPVPEASLVRPLGLVDPGTCAPFPAAQQCQGATPSSLDTPRGNFPMSVPGLGIPVGGVGAGSFMINQCGTFGPWNFGGQQGSSWETRVLPQAAFHIREEVGSAVTVRTLATAGPQVVGTEGPVEQRSWGSPLPAWNALQPGEGSYAALYPFGWISYKPFKTDISLRFFSPIVAKEDKRTSLPVVYFDLRIANNSSAPAKMSVMFTMPNATSHVEGTRADPTANQGPATVRKGYFSRYRNAEGVHGVTLGADDPSNTPDAARSEWTLAAMPTANQKASYVTSWNADGDGADIYGPFSASGRLPNQALDASSSAGALSISVNLSPGEVTTVSFALAWDFPQVGFMDNQTVWMRRYTNFYGASTDQHNEYVPGSYPSFQSFPIARDALAGHDAALGAVEGWWKPLADEQAIPKVLRMSALNQLSMLVFNNSFWEGGLVSNSVLPTGFPFAGPGQHLGASTPGIHLFGVQDTGGGGLSGMGATTCIQVYGYRAFFGLFPQLFRGSLLASAEATIIAANRNAPDLYMNIPAGSPFIRWGNAQDARIQSGTDSRPPLPGQTQWSDSPSKFIFEWYAYAKMTRDQDFLRATWPAMKHEIAFLQALIPAGTHLPVDSGVMTNIYNVYPQTGPGVYNSQLYLLALSAVIAAGEQLAVEEDYVRQLKVDLAAAKTEFETLFWNPVQNHYRFTNGGPYTDHYVVDTFLAQHLAETLGLPDLIDQNRHATHLRVNYPSSRAYNSEGELIGAALVALPLTPPLGVGATGIVLGSTYLAAADLYRTGARTADPTLKRHGIELGSAVSHQSWVRADNGFAFNPPYSWGESDTHVYAYPAYSQAMAVWDLVDAIKPIIAR